MKIYFLSPLIFLCMVSFSHARELTAEMRKFVDNNQRIWQSAEEIVEVPKPAPTGWYRVEEPSLGFSISFPCETTRTIEDRGGRSYLRHLCIHNGYAYHLVSSRQELSTADARRGFFTGSDYGFSRSHARNGLTATFLPLYLVSFDRASGRDTRVVTRGQETVKRQLALDEIGIEIAQSADSNVNYDEARIFFNSLEF